MAAWAALAGGGATDTATDITLAGVPGAIASPYLGDTNMDTDENFLVLVEDEVMEGTEVSGAGGVHLMIESRGVVGNAAAHGGGAAVYAVTRLKRVVEGTLVYYLDADGTTSIKRIESGGSISGDALPAPQEADLDSADESGQTLVLGINSQGDEVEARWILLSLAFDTDNPLPDAIINNTGIVSVDGKTLITIRTDTIAHAVADAGQNIVELSAQIEFLKAALNSAGLFWND